ncbi:hypothetical protein [Natronorubrum bangense]|uniref:C2H2-type domain-containing protein n=2 Tax=Natronorubrum bangense TaxID=61858 RepID=L9WJZ7_9EURY|nr:hypothetical protein [Natronorubrum bangense]ELY49784.1 hypothetical protein C494_07225 [Natronorubrum bangense JCM 10635]QCC55410.1 hypothetical protein DV706_13605 [Natronorubrum bangense]
MNNRHRCPLCTETYDERTSLHVHLEVEHRKSEIVTEFIELHDTGIDSSIDDRPGVASEKQLIPSAD